MDNKFPQIEVPCFEDYYGESHKDANPVTNPVTHNLKKPHIDNQEPTIIKIPPYSSWFNFDTIHQIESNAFPNLISDDVSLQHYKHTRNVVVKMYRDDPSKCVTIIRARKHVNCDIVNLIRIHAFLEKWGLINYKTEEFREIYKARNKINEPNVEIDSFRSTYFENERAVCKCGSVDKLYFTAKYDIFVCKTCMICGDYDTRCTSDDFKPFNAVHAQNLWSKKDELLLLNAVDKADDWHKIAKAVGKTREQCIMRFLNLDIKAASLEKHLALFDGSILNNMSNPLMSFIALICGSVHPKIASDAAKWALNNLKERNTVPATLIALTSTKAAELKEAEETRKENFLKKLVDLQIKKLELKMNEFEDLCNFVEKERGQYAAAREAYLREYETLKRLYLSHKSK